jgi:hypothetical protein
MSTTAFDHKIWVDLRNQSIRNAVAEGDECQGHKRRHSITDVRPVDLCDLAHHKASDLAREKVNGG